MLRSFQRVFLIERVLSYDGSRKKIGKEVYFWLNKKRVREALVAVMDYLKAQ